MRNRQAEKRNFLIQNTINIAVCNTNSCGEGGNVYWSRGQATKACKCITVSKLNLLELLPTIDCNGIEDSYPSNQRFPVWRRAIPSERRVKVPSVAPITRQLSEAKKHKTSLLNTVKFYFFATLCTHQIPFCATIVLVEHCCACCSMSSEARYGPMEKVLGKELFQTVRSSKVLVVGAGGIGCELLKNLVLSGFEDLEIVRIIFKFTRIQSFQIHTHIQSSQMHA